MWYYMNVAEKKNYYRSWSKVNVELLLRPVWKESAIFPPDQALDTTGGPHIVCINR